MAFKYFNSNNANLENLGHFIRPNGMCSINFFTIQKYLFYLSLAKMIGCFTKYVYQFSPPFSRSGSSNEGLYIQLNFHIIWKRKVLKYRYPEDRKNKNRLKRGEKSDTYMTHVCSPLQSIENRERVEKTGAFSQHYGYQQLQLVSFYS